MALSAGITMVARYSAAFSIQHAAGIGGWGPKLAASDANLTCVALFGFTGIAAATAGTAKLLFFIFIVIFWFYLFSGWWSVRQSLRMLGQPLVYWKHDENGQRVHVIIGDNGMVATLPGQ
jgi:uncharacterized membrane protein YtjA (UPF0391 family)